MTESRPDQSIAERLVGVTMLGLFWAAFASLALGLFFWIPNHASQWAVVPFTGGLIGLMSLPTLRLLSTIATAHRERDWLTLGSTIAVLAILLVLTLRDASGLR